MYKKNKHMHMKILLICILCNAFNVERQSNITKMSFSFIPMENHTPVLNKYHCAGFRLIAHLTSLRQL